MDISRKLRLIQEGNSIEDINAGKVSIFESINSDSLSLFTEGVISDIDSMSVMMIYESSGTGILVQIKKFLAWIREKISQFIKFITHKFSSNRIDTTKINKSIKESIDRIQMPEFRIKFEAQGVKQIDVYSNVFDYEKEDYFGNGVNIVFEVLNKRALEVLHDSSGDPTTVNPDIDNEQKFMNTIFNDCFDVNYSNNAIFDIIYGPIKKVNASSANLLTLYTRLSHLESQEWAIVNFVKSTISKDFSNYEAALNIHIARAEEKINRINNPEIQDHETEILAKNMDAQTIAKQNYLMEVNRVKVQQISKLYKYTFKLANEFMMAHKTVTDKLRSDIVVTVNV